MKKTEIVQKCDFLGLFYGPKQSVNGGETNDCAPNTLEISLEILFKTCFLCF